MLLAGDIGGTKTEIALYDNDGGIRRPLVRRRYPSGSFGSLENVIVAFLHDQPEANVTHASFGVAGPIFGNQARITNLPWTIDADSIAARFGWKYATLLNDIAAIAHAVPNLEADEVFTVSAGQSVERGTLAIIAPGTGLGQGFLVWKGVRYRSLGSEGGHKSFSPNDELQLALLTYLQPRLGHVSVERVCSGIGIPNLYAFLRDTGRYEEPSWLTDELAAARDLTPVIFDAAQAGKADICVATLHLFIDILANEAGNLALQLLSTGGIYLGGGITPRIVQHLTADDRFMRAFVRKGRFSKLLADVPVHVIINSDAALLGAAHYGLSAFVKTH
jgi:glucokinase